MNNNLSTQGAEGSDSDSKSQLERVDKTVNRVADQLKNVGGLLSMLAQVTPKNVFAVDNGKQEFFDLAQTVVKIAEKLQGQA